MDCANTVVWMPSLSKCDEMRIETVAVITIYRHEGRSTRKGDLQCASAANAPDMPDIIKIMHVWFW